MQIKKIAVFFMSLGLMSGVQAFAEEICSGIVQHWSDEVIKFYIKINQRIDFPLFLRLSDYALFAKDVMGFVVVVSSIMTSLHVLKMIKYMFSKKGDDCERDGHYAVSVFFIISTMMEVVLYKIADSVFKKCTNVIEFAEMFTRLQLQ